MARYKETFARFSSACVQAPKAANDNTRGGGGGGYDGMPPKGPRPVTHLTDGELASLEHNHISKGVTVGPLYTLREIRNELMRREARGYDGKHVTRTIMELCASSPHFVVTYGELYKALHPTEEWSAHGSLNKIKRSLGACILYCVENDLPIISTLVVRASDNDLSDGAKTNIYNTCERLGHDVGGDPEDFVLRNTIAAMYIVQNNHHVA